MRNRRRHSKYPEWLPFSSPTYNDEDCAAWANALRPMDYPDGPAVWLEQSLADLIGVRPDQVLVTNSATAALAITYHFFFREQARLGLPQELEAPVMTWPASYAPAPSYTLVDGDVNGTMWSKKKGIIRTDVQLYGRPYNLAPREDSSLIVLDAAQNLLDPEHRVLLSQKDVDAVVYSFGPVKQISAVRGGCVISPHITPEWRAFRDSGTVGRYATYPFGCNYEIGEPNAALAMSQLRRFPDMQEHRKKILEIYEHTRGCVTTGIFSGHLAVVQARDPLQAMAWRTALTAAKIKTGLHYPLPLHLPAVNFPHARDLADTAVTIPCHCSMTLNDARLVSKIIRSCG